MTRTIAIACLLLLGVCAHAQEAVDPRGKKLDPTVFQQPSLAPVAAVVGTSRVRLNASAIVTLSWDDEGRVTDAQIERTTGDRNVDRALKAWAGKLRLKTPVEAGSGYLPLELSNMKGPGEECFVVVQNASGQLARQALPSLHVRNTVGERFALPADAPANVKMIQCTRPSLLPEDADFKVVEAGFPFSISAGKRVGLLTTEGGQLRYKLLAGELSEAETTLIDAQIKRARERTR